MSAPNPNRSAAPAEAIILRGEIEAQIEMRRALEKRAASAASALHDAEVALQAAQEARDAVRRIIDCIEQQQRSVDEVVLAAQGLLHPIRRLPDEVLSMIFEVGLTVQITRANHRMPFVISAVCRRWRAMVLSTPALWSTIRCEVLALTDQDAANRWASYFDAHFDRSRGLTLDVDVIVGGSDITPNAASTFWNALSHVYTRSKCFTVRCRRFTPTMRECISSSRAPHMEELAFDEPEEVVGTATRFTLDAPSLKTLAYKGQKLPFKFSARATCSTVCTVTTVVGSLTPWDLRRLFKICPEVEVVDLTAKVADLTSSRPLVIASPRLKTLTLVMKDSLMMDLHVAQSFSFPSLQSAHLGVPDELHRDTAVLNAFIASAFSTVTSLELHNVVPGIDEGLKACMGLEDLTVHAGRFRDQAVLRESFCLALCASDPAGSWMCPRLRRLSIADPYLAMTVTDQRFRHAMMAIARARCATSPNLGLRPLEKLAIRSSVASSETCERILALQECLDTILAAS